VDRTLPKERTKALGPVIAKQLDAKQAEISQSFRFGGWSILYVSTGEADDAFVFYSGDPMRSKYVTLWGGVALENEEREIRAWTLKNAPGIPRTGAIQANCEHRRLFANPRLGFPLCWSRGAKKRHSEVSPTIHSR
jgi:hypothetical protein